MKSILFVRKLLGLVEMTFALVNAFFSLPKWQAVKMIFFAPLNIQRGKEGKRYLQQRILNYGVRGCTLYKQRGHPTILLVKLQPFFNFAKCNLDVC